MQMKADKKLVHENFQKSVEALESKPENIGVISFANKSTKFSEKTIPASLCDACVLAQRDEALVITEDFLYLQMNAMETGKDVPRHCSAFALIRVLYEQGKVSFGDYLNFFGYLSFYRFRFLPITIEDLEKGVIGDGPIKTIKPEELRKFRFSLTLSEEYGVPIRTASALVGHLVIKLLIDDSISPETIERVFSEILSSFPTKHDKKLFGESLLTACVQVLNKRSHEMVLGAKVQDKIDALAQFIRFYSTGEIILPSAD